MKKKASFKELPLRIFLKATSWRIFATCDTVLLAYLIYHRDISSALKIGVSEVFTKIGLFYVHERFVWAKIKFGRIYNEKGEIIGDKHYRSIVKGASWRFFGTLDTICLSLFWTHDYKVALTIGATEVITKIGLFWLHERLWFKVKWGQPNVATAAEATNNTTPIVSAEQPKKLPLAI